MKVLTDAGQETAANSTVNVAAEAEVEISLPYSFGLASANRKKRWSPIDSVGWGQQRLVFGQPPWRGWL